MDSNFACPRCKKSFNLKNQEDTVESPTIIPCPHCSFKYSLSDFKKQSKRLGQKRAWPNDPDEQRNLSDIPSSRSNKKTVQIKFIEWILWKFGHKKTTAILALRSSIHQLFLDCVNLCELYPAIPHNLKSKAQLKKFWVDPEHEFILGSIKRHMNEADKIARDYFNKELLTRDEIYEIIDKELPHANWAALTVTYNIMKPEFRGFLLAIMMLNAQSNEIITLVKQIQSWIEEDGWDEYGKAKTRDDN